MIHSIDRTTLSAAVRPLCERANVLRLELVGSAARADFDATRSDVDFLVDFKDTPGFDYFGAYMTASLASIVGRLTSTITARGIENPFLRGFARAPGRPTSLCGMRRRSSCTIS
ncbi:MAG: nucleotidyltransferase domain-containing protein [Phycisphaerales bacterium]